LYCEPVTIIGGRRVACPFHPPFLDQQPLFNSFNLAKPGHFSYIPSDVNRTAYISRVSTFVCPSDNPSITPLGPCSYGGNLGWGLGKYPRPDNGPFASSLIDPKIRDALVRDGLSNTVAVSEFCGTQGRLTPRDRHAVFTIGSYGRSQFDSMISDCSAVNISKQPIASAFRGICWAFGGPLNALYDHDLTPNRPTCNCSGGAISGVYTASSNHSEGVNCAHLDGHVSFIKDAVSIQAWRALGTISGSEIIPND
jgi:prepilin-type processing-associated H-X9-DG protein